VRRRAHDASARARVQVRLHRCVCYSWLWGVPQYFVARLRGRREQTSRRHRPAVYANRMITLRMEPTIGRIAANVAQRIVAQSTQRPPPAVDLLRVTWQIRSRTYQRYEASTLTSTRGKQYVPVRISS
jgi:hypothetical protein